MNNYDVIVKPLITEKTTALSEHNKVVFLVNRDSDKSKVKQAVQDIFKVSVSKINIIYRKGKTKKFRGTQGKRVDQKIAIVTLEKGSSIDIMGGVK